MFLKDIKLLQFKNYENSELEFSEKINCFTGLNGSGKTNLLDAIYYLSFTKSFFNSSDKQNIKYEKDFFVVQANFSLNDKIEKIYCGYKKGKKKNFKRNNKSYNRFSEHIGLLPVVMISPADSRLILGRSEERRKYVDSVISQYDKEYLYVLIKYNRILEQRNKLLKDLLKNEYNNIETLHIYDEQLVSSGEIIYKKRLDFTNKLLPIFSDYYQFISKKREEVELIYQSQLIDNDFSSLLKQTHEKDRFLQYTTSGVHRDDLVLKINKHSIKKTGSQGQQKTFLISLKFAQFEFIKNISRIKPILLLDDIFDKFDADRVKQIIKLISEDKFGQIFITDTNSERVKKVLEGKDADYKFFKIDNGAVKEN